MTMEKALADALEEKMSDEILRMIETVDPSDTLKLDEIDARVWYIVEGYRWYPNCEVLRVESPGGIVLVQQNRESITRFPSRIREYTLSRDALKAIRPEGWIFAVHWRETSKGLYPTGRGSRKDGIADVQSTKKLPTEELAELHAIIQAIEFERARSALQTPTLRTESKT